MGIPKNQPFLAKVNDEKKRRLQGTLGEGHDICYLAREWVPETQEGKVRGLELRGGRQTVSSYLQRGAEKGLGWGTVALGGRASSHLPSHLQKSFLRFL